MRLLTEVGIDATPARVWDVLTRFKLYADWNPLIPAVMGELREGAELEVSVSELNGRERVLRPTITRVDAERELRWSERLAPLGLLKGERFFRLTPLDGGRTTLEHGQDLEGIAVRFYGEQLARAVGGFAAMNQALKKRAETPGR